MGKKKNISTLKVASSVFLFLELPFVQLSTHKSIKMTAFWRQVGLNYVNYSAICARAVRAALKEPFKTNTAGRDVSFGKTSQWENGKVVKVAEGGMPISK